MSSQQILRIVDANLNRVGEGLRLLEDVSRLVLEDSALSEKLRGLRHRVLDFELNEVCRLVEARDVEKDPGFAIEEAQHRPGGTIGAVIASAHRVEQALRVLEEVAKVDVLALPADTLKQCRFELYSLEKEILMRLRRQDKKELLKGCYAIINTSYYPDAPVIQLAKAILDEGVAAIELNDPGTNREALVSRMMPVRNECDKHRALLFITHHLDVALACHADGLCLQEGDLAPQTARRLLPEDILIGYTVNSDEEALTVREEVDFLIYRAHESGSVEEVLRRVAQLTSLPVVAMGELGIDGVLSSGACCIGVEINSGDIALVQDKIRKATSA